MKHNAAQPFKVLVGGQEIEDIGTEFNVSGYADEAALRTTLVEGSVSVAHDGRRTILKPGEAAVSKGEQFIVGNANVEEATAWLQGKLIFHNERLESILKKVSKLYDTTMKPPKYCR